MDQKLVGQAIAAATLTTVVLLAGLRDSNSDISTGWSTVLRDDSILAETYPTSDGNYIYPPTESVADGTAAHRPEEEFIAFESEASNLVEVDANQKRDVFLHHRGSGQTRRITSGNGDSGRPSISWSGRFVAFESDATDLALPDTNQTSDVFVYDLSSGRTSRVSVNDGGVEGDRASWLPAISAGGRHVAFASWARNLVPGDGNGYMDIFVHDRLLKKTRRASVHTNGREADEASMNPAVSADGRYVTFLSFAFNIVDQGATGAGDIYCHDFQTGETTLVSVHRNPGGLNAWESIGRSSISANGRFVAFDSYAEDLVLGDQGFDHDVFLRDRVLGITTRLSIAPAGAEANAASWGPSISADGRYVAFVSEASNLVPDDTNGAADIFLRDVLLGITTRISRGVGGEPANRGSDYASISPKGTSITFSSYASNLVGGVQPDRNGHWDVFVFDQSTNATTRVSVSSLGAEGNGPSSRSDMN